jgi:hypothetical protein
VFNLAMTDRFRQPEWGGFRSGSSLECSDVANYHVDIIFGQTVVQESVRVFFVLCAIGNGVEQFLIRHTLDIFGAQVPHWHFRRCGSLPTAIAAVATGTVLIEKRSSPFVLRKRRSDQHKYYGPAFVQGSAPSPANLIPIQNEKPS